ncbi:ubiquinone/menaquinone biosynthesis methyltransferase [Gammaproteobacteria bacterium]|nr:ubiquinone/menaquinone biosynthesis methyltransferase [Gammaproteobacteria bacterium]
MEDTFIGEDLSQKNKSEKVSAVFSNVAGYYRFMNDAMCMGTHRIWRRNAVLSLDCAPSDHVLDLACGTGDCGELIIDSIPHGHLYCVDPCEEMLIECRKKVSGSNVEYIHSTAESLSKMPSLIDKTIICFGIRNFTCPKESLQAVYANMRTGGKIVILEFNPPESSQVPGPYLSYIKNVLPKLGKKVIGDEYSYQYLCDSIRQEPTPNERRETLSEAGFDMINYQPISLGILGIFEAYKY